MRSQREGDFPIGLSMQSSVCSVEDVLGDDCSDLELWHALYVLLIWGRFTPSFWFVCFARLLKSSRLKHFFFLSWFLLILRNCMFNLKKIQGNHIYVLITLIVRMCLSSFEVGSGGQCKVVFSGGCFHPAPFLLRLNMVGQICNPSTQEVEAGGSGI